MEDAAQVRELDQFRQLTLFSGLDLARIFPQFGFDVVQFQSPVDVRLIGNFIQSIMLVIGFIHGLQAILIQRIATTERALPDGDIVFLASSEVLKCKGELGAGDGA